MTNPSKPVLGVTVRRARPTLAGAFWLATVLSIPVAILGLLIELLWRMAG